MAKKKKKGFQKALKENAKKIKVKLPGCEDCKTLAEAVDDTVEGVTATTVADMVPVTVAEAAENMTDLPYLAVSTQYTNVVKSMYEGSLKSTSRKQSMIIPLDTDAAEDIDCSSRWNAIYDTLVENTDIGIVMDAIPKKVWKKAAAWANDNNAGNAFVVRIPNLLMFSESIKKSIPAEPTLFDLMLVFVNASEKSMKKAKKRNPKEFDEFSKEVVKDILDVLKNYGSSSAHVPLWDEFFADPYDYAHAWAASLAMEKQTTLKRLMFSTMYMPTLISFNQELARVVNSDDGNGIRVV